MKHIRGKLGILVMTVLLAGGLAGCGAAGKSGKAVKETKIILSEGGVTWNDALVGTDGEAAVYVTNDIIYYEDRETYESGDAYGEGSQDERHSADTAAAHTVVNITQPGTYRIQGSLEKGQIRVDLGEKAKTDPEAVVTLILDGVDLTCEVAPAILFLNVYECDSDWSTETASSAVDTSKAGANLVIADDSVNQITGSHVARIYKDGGQEKKLWKQDGAVYSYMSMNVSGENKGTGAMDITADNEGMDTELHLTVNGGNINIRALNDGINTNEDGVSVTTINGGNIHIIAGLGQEGDGIDSNGWLVINGGTVIASANPAADAGLDSDMGSFINGGYVVALGSTMDWAESDSDQVTMNLQFASYQDSDSAIVITDQEGKYIFAYDPSEDEVLGENIRKYSGAIISCPEFAVDDSYYVYIGGTVRGSDVTGVYAAESIDGYEGGVQQTYTGTDVMRFPMGGFGGNFPGGGEGQMPSMPEGGFGGNFPGGGEGQMPSMPEGGFGENFPGGKDGQMPEGGDFSMFEGGDAVSGEENDVFYMQDKVNFFSGVAAKENTL